MPVYDQSYQHWDGGFLKSPFRWLPMVRYHIKLAMKRKLIWLMLFLSFVPAIVFAFIIYFFSQNEPEASGPVSQGMDMMLEALTKDTGIDPGAMELEDKYWFLTRFGFLIFLVWPQSFVVLVASSLVGSGLIARDIRSNALEIYLTKPITPLDYVIGKLAVIGFFVFLTTFVPSAFIFFVASGLWPGYAAAAWPILLPLLGVCLMAAFVNGMVILGLSSLAKSARYATAIWFALCFLTGLTSTILQQVTRDDSFFFLGYRNNFAYIATEMFGAHELFSGSQVDFVLPAAEENSVLVPVAILAACVGLSALILARTIRSAENR